jgi:hypothetical protein
VGNVPSQPADDRFLTRLRAAIDQLYGDRSDRGRAVTRRRIPTYDVAVFLKDVTDRWQEFDRLADLATDILDETGELVHAIPYRAGAYEDRTLLMREIRYEGVDL